MPELPEVEHSCRTLIAAGCCGLRVQSLAVHYGPSIQDSMELKSKLQAGKETIYIIEHIARRGKWMVLSLTRGFILVHLKMSGRLWLVNATDSHTGYERIIFGLSDGRQLRFHDPRKFGRVITTVEPEHHLAQLGREPLGKDFSIAWFTQLLAQHSRMIKPLLLDQHYVAGLGNIYTDEALWLAAIHPQQAANSLHTAKIVALHQAIIHVLQKGIKNCGTSLGRGMPHFNLPGVLQPTNQEQLEAYAQHGKPCSRCRTPIIKVKVAQRGSHICPQCQMI